MWDQFFFAISVLVIAFVLGFILRFILDRFLKASAQKIKVDRTPCDALRSIKEKFTEAKVEMAYPHRILIKKNVS